MHIDKLHPRVWRWALAGCLVCACSVAQATVVNDTIQATIQATANKNVIQGKVIDGTDNQPMVGVTVMVEGTTNGVTTDVDGHFTLAVQGKCNIVFSFIGYKKAVMKYDGKNRLTR